ncbi:MAG: Gmad2 immunoglobulin-like domain-containing protein [Actinomycetota bacterium]|nr:Gmad2 immunoglobulin-like domain-containing protein [Actinomycetota bacterium]
MRAYHVGVCMVVLLILLAAGCAQTGREEQGTGTGEESSGGQAGQEQTSEDYTDTTEAPFTAAPEMSGGSEEPADGIREVTFERREGYERAVILFGSGGGLASGVPSWSLSSPEGEGYARITFPDVEVTLDSDGGFGGSILDNFYVVRAPGGGLFVDLYATGAFQYRVTELSDPGRLVVDFRPASVDLSYPIPVQAQRTLVFEPRPREAITSPLAVSGYSRNPEASNTIALVDADGNVLARSTTLSNDWLDTWGYFESSLEFPAFEGTATLRVGGVSARDGSFEGAEVPVTYGGDGG